MELVSKIEANEGPPGTWVDFICNKQLVIGTFAGRIPQFDKVQLEQLTLSELGDLRISFNLLELPDGSPQRWIQKNYDRLQLRFTFDMPGKFSIVGMNFEPGLDVAVEFNEGGTLRVSHERLQIEVSSEMIRLELYPYDSNVFEEPRHWRYM